MPPSSGILAATSGAVAAITSTPRTNAGATSARTALTTSASIRVTLMKILVTGGGGFIGSHVADAYIAAGHQVAILDDFSTGSEANVNREAEVLRRRRPCCGRRAGGLRLRNQSPILAS